VHQLFAEEGQNGSIGQLKQKKADGEDEKATVFEEKDAANPPRICSVLVGSATCSAEINVSRANPEERQKHRDSQGGGEKEVIWGGREVADNTENRSGREATDRGEALIAAEPLGERIMPNEPETDCGDPWPNDASAYAQYDRGNED